MKLLKTIATYLCAGINVATIFMLWLCCVTTYISPVAFPRLSLMPLMFPVFALANLVFIPFWLIFKTRNVWIPLVGFAACFSFVWDYCPLNFSAETDTPADSCLRLISFNTHSYGGTTTCEDLEFKAVAEFLYTSDADIICLQESGGGGSKATTVKQKMLALGYETFEHGGAVLFSRLPIIETEALSYPTRTNGGLRALLLYGQDTILLINNHFESNHISSLLKSDYRDAIKNHALEAYGRDIRDSIRSELSPVVNLLAVAAPLRAAQTDSIRQLVRQWQPRPVIVMGDFNDTPVSHAVCTLTKDLVNAYTESGTGVGFTYHDRGFPVRIDHILFSGGHWKSHNTHVDRSVFQSDHYPIRTTLTKK